jgi:tetratricopeptide (TPR) repeat protein
VLKSHPDDATGLLLRGQLRIDQHRFEDGLVDLQHATRTDPTSAPAHYYLAIAELQQRKDTLARGELKAALELQPNLVAARTLLAQLELNSGDQEKALADLETVTASKPATLDPYIARSVLLAKRGNSAKATDDLLPLLNEFPQPAERAVTYRALAWIAFNQKKYSDARKFLDRAESLQSQSKDTLYLYGLTYIAEKNLDAARSFLQQRLKKNPEWAEGYEAAGELCAMAGRYPDSEASFQKALSINPKLTSAWQGLGQVLDSESKFDAALAAFEKVTQQSPDSTTAYLSIAQLQDKRGEWTLAQTAYQKVLQLDPDNVAAKNNLAWNYAEHGGNIDVALRLAQEANQSSPDNPEVCDTLGWVYIKKNAPASAVQVLKKSLALAPNNPEYNYHLGVAYLREGDAVRAKDLLRAAVHIEPHSTYTEEAKNLLVTIKE